MNLEEKVFNEAQGFMDLYKETKEIKNIYIASQLITAFALDKSRDTKMQQESVIEAVKVYEFLKKETENE